MNASGGDAISVVITTYQRPDACERALRSVLAQTEPPLEVLVCDDGSLDDTEGRISDWERRDKRIRYLRISPNSGTPATTRNLGIEQARGDWIAFLDDDDEWLPDKLATQRAALKEQDVDMIASNALRSDGSAYLSDTPTATRPTWTQLLKANPIITSSAIVRRDRLLSAGGFQTDRWVRGVEDYLAWLELADQGARLLVLGEPLVRYEDASSDRLSVDRIRTQTALARIAWTHALRRPIGAAGVLAALRHSAGIGHVLGSDALTYLRATHGSPGGRRS